MPPPRAHRVAVAQQVSAFRGSIRARFPAVLATRTARSPCFAPFLASAAGLMCLCDSQGCADLTCYVFKLAEALSSTASRCSTRQKCGTPHRGAQWSIACRPRADQVVHGARRCLPGAQQHVHTAAVPARARRLVCCAHRPPPSRCTKQQQQQQQQQQPAQRQEAAETLMERHASLTYSS
jgi:hypothetical protein